MGGGSFATMASGVQQVSKGRQGLPADNQVQVCRVYTWLSGKDVGA